MNDYEMCDVLCIFGFCHIRRFDPARLRTSQIPRMARRTIFVFHLDLARRFGRTSSRITRSGNRLDNPNTER